MTPGVFFLIIAGLFFVFAVLNGVRYTPKAQTRRACRRMTKLVRRDLIPAWAELGAAAQRADVALRAFGDAFTRGLWREDV